MKLTTNFNLEDFTISQEAIRKGLNNDPDQDSISNLKALCENVLEKLEDIGLSIFISSGYRSPEVNKAIGGAATSQHCKGQAADISAKGYTPEQLFQLIKKSGLPFDQLIQEFDRWVHVSYVPKGRKQSLKAVKENGKTVYLPY